MDTQVRNMYAIHESAHALVAHVCGFRVTGLTLTENSGACNVDRPIRTGDDGQFVRDHPKDPRSSTLLSLLKRDLAGWLAGITIEDLFSLQGDPTENETDTRAAGTLADHIAHATWVRTDPRPDFAKRETAPQYLERVKQFVKVKLLQSHLPAIHAVADRLERERNLSEGDIRELLETNGAHFASVSDTELP